MNDPTISRLEDYFRGAETWSQDRERTHRLTVRGSLIVAGVMAVIALLEAIALISLAPLKTVVPYTLLVDRQTGHVQALKPLDQQTIAPETALTRSFLAQYVIARESFDIDSLREDYRKVALLSAGEARDQYLARMQASNPLSPLATLPKRAVVDVQIRSLVPINSDTALVHFSTIRSDPGSQAQEPQLWASLVKYRYSRAEMSSADRLTNPLGFQVVRYRRTAEMLPVPPPAAPVSAGASEVPGVVVSAPPSRSAP